MTTLIQNVIKNFTKVTLKNISRKALLHMSLLIISKDRKNYASMARENHISYKKAYVDNKYALRYANEHKAFLIELIKELEKSTQGYLIFDFTHLEKTFSQKIPQVTYDYDGSRKQVSKGFSAGFIFWSNGKITIPFDYDLWLREKDAGDSYKTKIQIAQELLMSAKHQGVPVKEVRLDGAFMSEFMINFLIENKINFTARIPSNRVIQTENEKNQLRNHSELQMKGNEKFKTISGTYKGISLYFTAQKRNGTNKKKEVVFIVSDIKRSPKGHVVAYDGRWPSEKYFRSGKQHIGLGECQSTNADKQRFHIFSVMTSYAILQSIKYDKKKKSVEEIIHDIRRRNLKSYLTDYIDWEQTFEC